MAESVIKGNIARAFMSTQAVYFAGVAMTLSPDESHFLDVWFLHVQGMFISAAIANVVIVAFQPKRTVVVLTLAVVGLATLLRAVDAISVADDIGAKVRATGWAMQWMLAVVCTMQIIGADVLRKTRSGISD